MVPDGRKRPRPASPNALKIGCAFCHVLHRFVPDYARHDDLSVLAVDDPRPDEVVQKGLRTRNVQKFQEVPDEILVIAVDHAWERHIAAIVKIGDTFRGLFFEHILHLVLQAADDPAGHFTAGDSGSRDDLQKCQTDILDQLLFIEIPALLAPQLVKRGDRRREEDQEEGGKLPVLTAFPVRVDEKMQNGVLRPITFSPVVKKSDERVWIRVGVEVGAGDPQLLVELSEWFRVQFLLDTGKRKAHASDAAWASRALDSAFKASLKNGYISNSVTICTIREIDNRPGAGSTVIFHKQGSPEDTGDSHSTAERILL
jgi:hypothetical protein